MSKQGTVFGLLLTLISTSAMAELPEQSILTRYGITPDQLPVAQAGDRVETPSPKPRFEIQPEQPWGAISLGETMQPQVTGNISIDNSVQQEYERCRRLQAHSLMKKGGMINCEDSSVAPGLSPGSNR